jgi:hypothetical protein
LVQPCGQAFCAVAWIIGFGCIADAGRQWPIRLADQPFIRRYDFLYGTLSVFVPAFILSFISTQAGDCQRNV